MANEKFNKETFQKEIRENVKSLYRKTLEEATPQQVFQAVSYAVEDVIMDQWIKTQEIYNKQDPKTV